MKTQEENIVDRKKFKSVEVPVDTYKDLVKLAEMEHRSIPMQITWIVKQEADKLTKESA